LWYFQENSVDLFGVWGLGFGVWGLGFGVWGLGFGVWGLGFGVWGLGFLPGDGLAVFILPDDACIDAAALDRHGAGFLPRAELVMPASFDRQRARPAADPVLALARFEDESGFAVVAAGLADIGVRFCLVTRRPHRPAVGEVSLRDGCEKAE
jgi:hypothetical protein